MIGKQSTKGVVLVISLFIMVAVIALGVGALFLTQMNLHIAKNTHDQLIARYQAEAAHAVALDHLQNHLEAHGSFPGTADDLLHTVEAAALASHMKFNIMSYTASETSDRPEAWLALEGHGLAGSRYVSEVHLTAAADAQIPSGLRSEGRIEIKGSTGARHTFTDAGIHANSGFFLEGDASYNTCSSLGCQSYASVEEIPVSTTSTGSCQGIGLTHASLCSNGLPSKGHIQDAVSIAVPPYETIKMEHFGIVGSDPLKTPACVQAKARCLRGNQDTLVLPAGQTVIIFGDLLIQEDRHFDDMTMLVTGDVIIDAAVKLSNSRILAEGQFLHKGTLDYGGSVTLGAAGKNQEDAAMLLEGTMTQAHGDPEAGLLMLSVGALKIQGDINACETCLLDAFFWVGDHTYIQGDMRLRGGISSVADLSMTGNITVLGNDQLDNTDLTVGSKAKLVVLSKR